jgi:hypothetical protein
VCWVLVAPTPQLAPPLLLTADVGRPKGEGRGGEAEEGPPRSRSFATLLLHTSRLRSLHRVAGLEGRRWI